MMDMVLLVDSFLTVEFCRGRETRPTAQEPIDYAVLIHRSVPLHIAM